MDGGFGLLKKAYRKADVDTAAQFCTIVEDSADFNHAEQYCWEWRAWDQFLGKYFKPVRNITRFQKFVFSKDTPGKVF